MPDSFLKDGIWRCLTCGHPQPCACHRKQIALFADAPETIKNPLLCGCGGQAALGPKVEWPGGIQSEPHLYFLRVSRRAEREDDMKIIWNNVWTTPNRWMASYLRRRGWVCFYLEEPSRHCGLTAPTQAADCWLHLYQESLRADARAK